MRTGTCSSTSTFVPLLSCTSTGSGARSLAGSRSWAKKKFDFWKFFMFNQPIISYKDTRSLKRKESKYEKSSKDHRSCEPAYAQIQPKARDRFSGADGQASREDLLRSRGELPRFFNHKVFSKQTPELWGGLLGRDGGKCHGLRLDCGPSREASLNKAGAQDNAPVGIRVLDEVRNESVGQGCRSEVRPRAKHCDPTRVGQTINSKALDFRGFFILQDNIKLIKEHAQAHAQAQAQDPGSMVDGPRTKVRPNRSQTQAHAQARPDKNKLPSLLPPLP